MIMSESQVGNEFGAVEALWSQFEHVMARDEGVGKEGDGEEGEEVGDDGEGGEGRR